MIIYGDSINELKQFNDNYFDSVVTDPPYGLSACTEKHIREALKCWLEGESYSPSGPGFMGKDWDSFVPGPELWGEVFRVLKPGGHALVFAGSRTQDLMGLALRLAGFEVRDILQWIYGSGFPKSHNVALSIDKLNGGENRGRAIPRASSYQASDQDQRHKLTSNPVEAYQAKSEESQNYQGWGTALKPAYEPILLVRKPLIGTVAKNVIEHGTGGLNIDGCRIPLKEGESTFVQPRSKEGAKGSGGWANQSAQTGSMNRDCEKGRWPANVILDDQASAILDHQSGHQKSGIAGENSRSWGVGEGQINSWQSYNSAGYQDKGGASRFFFTPKASKGEKNAGVKDKNTHVTVKPIDLMKYLIRLITPPNGIVLEPFAGSGTTLCAAVQGGFDFVGIEREAEYIPIIKQRVKYWSGYTYEIEEETDEDQPQPDQMTLF